MGNIKFIRNGKDHSRGANIIFGVIHLSIAVLILVFGIRVYLGFMFLSQVAVAVLLILISCDGILKGLDQLLGKKE